MGVGQVAVHVAGLQVLASRVTGALHSVRYNYTPEGPIRLTPRE